MKKRLLIVLCLWLVGCVTTVDKSLPYAELPEIKLATAATLVASPSHPASYLSTEELPAGTTLQVLGRDENAAWLLVSHENSLGWIPSFFSGTNVGTLETAIVVEPLSAQCTKYLGATATIDEPWQSTVDGAVIVVGSILRTDTNTDFSAASLSIEIDGRGTAVDSDYLHTPLTPSSSVVFFAYSITNLQEGDSIGFAVSDGGEEAAVLQAAFFSNSCAPDHVKLPIGTLKQDVEKASAAQVAETSQLAVVQKSTNVITHGTYIWSVRASNIDDASAIFVNGEMVAGSVYWDRRGDTDWIDITDYIVANQDTQVTFVSLNGISLGAWGFYIRRGETIIWGQENEDPTEHNLQFVKRLIIDAKGEISEAETGFESNSSLSGTWLMHVQDIDDIGIVLVNGQPVGGGFLCRNCPADERQHAEVIDITSWLTTNQENQIAVAAWSIDSPFSYRFVLEHDGIPVWQQDKSGEASAGLVFSEIITITTEGDLQLASSQRMASAGEQESASPIVADNECNVIPAERCIVSDAFDSWAVGELPELTGNDSWTQFQVADPTVIFYEGKFHLWFNGQPSQDGDWSIGYASSDNGNDWDVYSTPVMTPDGNGTWEGTNMGSPSVIVKDGHFEMYYFSGWPASIGLATSEDGIHWEKSSRNPVLVPDPNVPWMSYNLYYPSVIYHDGAYEMWFAGSGGKSWQDTWQIGHAVSDDGYTWRVSSNQPVIGLGSSSSWKSQSTAAPDVILIDGTYHMWYSGRAKTQPDDWRIGHATSPDGLIWTDDLNNPVFGLGAADGFANGRVSNPAIAVSTEGFHLWYSAGQTNSSSSELGYATSRDGVRWLR